MISFTKGIQAILHLGFVSFCPQFLTTFIVMDQLACLRFSELVVSLSAGWFFSLKTRVPGFPVRPIFLHNLSLKK